jgi:hypothetical protein
MAADIFVRRRKANDLPPWQDVLVPTSRESAEWLKGVPYDDILKCKVTRPRNKRQHDKLFACASLVATNCDFNVTPRQIIAGYQKFAGLGDTVKFKTGEIFTPKSIAFDAMGQEAFAELYDGFIEWLCTHVIPGLKRHQLEAEAESRLLEFAA